MKFKNPFSRNKHLKELRSLSSSFAILDELERRGLLHYHYHRPSHSVSESRSGAPGASGALLIEESLAIVKIAEGAKGFRHFLNQVALWQNYRLFQDAYETRRLDIEAKAVREAQRSVEELCNGTLTTADIQRIRQHARAHMPEIDTSDPKVLKDLHIVTEFDLFIIRANAPSSALATESNGQLIAVGHYNGITLEMALYDDIKHNLQKEE